MSIYDHVAATKSEGTSKEQMEVVYAIRRCRNRHPGYGPSVRELTVELGRSSNDVYQKLVRLRRDGLVEWDDNVARSIRVVGE